MAETSAGVVYRWADCQHQWTETRVRLPGVACGPHLPDRRRHDLASAYLRRPTDRQAEEQ